MAGAHLQIAFERPPVGGEGKLGPRQLFGFEQCDLRALRTGAEARFGEACSVHELNLPDGAQAVDREQAGELERDLGLFLGLPQGTLLRCLAELEIAGGQVPETFARGYGAATEKDLVLVSRDHSHYDAGVLIDDEAAVRAKQALSIVSGGDRSGAGAARAHPCTVLHPRRDSKTSSASERLARAPLIGHVGGVELDELARQVLTSRGLDDKMRSPEVLSDERPKSAIIPAGPARPPRLRFHDERPRVAFPGPAEIHRPEARGRVLHFFANHELLAIELMAVCLLKFPAAPTAFRMGVGRTLLEEQAHLRRYRERMAALGVELGDVPVSGYFWRVLAGMESPLAYVTGMSLVFEQANLDHAAAWVRGFAAVDDEESSTLMAQVLEEEIGHVKHGATWFERWRPPGEAFAAFCAALPPGLDAVRARGPEMEEAARLRAGLSPDFVRALRHHRGSKGRRPRLWVFWPDVEEHAAGRAQPSRMIEKLTRDLTPAFGLLGSEDDLLLAPSLRPEHVERLDAAGLTVPRPIPDVESAAEARPDEVEAWGWSEVVRRRLAPLAEATRVPFPRAGEAQFRKERILEARADWVRDGYLSEDRLGVFARTANEAKAAVWRLGAPVVLKAPFGASGRHQRRVFDVFDAEDHTWTQRVCSTEGGVLIERWSDRVADFGFVVPSRGKPQLLRTVVDARGAYRGHQLGPPELGLSREEAAPLTRFPNGGLAGLARRLHRSARAAVRSGPVGIDLFVERRDEQFSLQPLCEINARYTMGHVAAALRRRLAPGRVGLWLHLRPSDLRAAGASGFAELAANWPPPRLSTHRRLESGVVPTSDADQAEAVLSVLTVGESLEAARSALGLEGL